MENKFIKILQQIKNEKELKAFIEGIFTKSELEQVETRIQIIKSLKNGISQHQIASDLKIGVATVSRGAKELKDDKTQTKFKYVK